MYKIIKKSMAGMLLVIVALAFSDFSLNSNFVAQLYNHFLVYKCPLYNSFVTFNTGFEPEEMFGYKIITANAPYGEYVINKVDKYRKKLIVHGNVDVIKGDMYAAREVVANVIDQSPDSNVPVENEPKSKEEPHSITVKKDILKQYYIVDSTTSVDKKLFNKNELLGCDLTMKKSDKPQILIYHTHGASESFRDSRPGEISDGVVGIGDHLAKVLTEQYGYNVIHDRTCYDMVGGRIDRSYAYANALPAISKILKENPDIQVVIDLHRDAVADDQHTFAEVNGKKCARIMLFNGTSRSSTGEREYLHNENLPYNLAFSLKLKLKGEELYPGLMKPIYLKGYRYNLHLKKRCLLVELGNQNNTIKEEKNAIEPFAHILNDVLEK